MMRRKIGLFRSAVCRAQYPHPHPHTAGRQRFCTRANPGCDHKRASGTRTSPAPAASARYLAPRATCSVPIQLHSSAAQWPLLSLPPARPLSHLTLAALTGRRRGLPGPCLAFLPPQALILLHPHTSLFPFSPSPSPPASARLTPTLLVQFQLHISTRVCAAGFHRPLLCDYINFAFGLPFGSAQHLHFLRGASSTVLRAPALPRVPCALARPQQRWLLGQTFASLLARPSQCSLLASDAYLRSVLVRGRKLADLVSLQLRRSRSLTPCIFFERPRSDANRVESPSTTRFSLCSIL